MLYVSENIPGPTEQEVRFSYQLWQEVQRKDRYRSKFMAKWCEEGLDLCIAPSFACPAPLSKDMDQLTCNLAFLLFIENSFS